MSAQNIIPEGESFICKAAHHGVQSTKSGRQQYYVACQIQDGPYKGAILDYTGGLDGQGLEYTIKALRAMGFAGDFGRVELGKAFRVKCRHYKKDDGRVFAQAGYIDPLPGNESLSRAQIAHLNRCVQALASGTAMPDAPLAEPDPIAFDADNFGAEFV